MIVSMDAALGDQCRSRAEVIAVIEANTSLQIIRDTGPAGRHRGGEAREPRRVGIRPTPANHCQLRQIFGWTSRSFPGDSQQVRTGMPVTIRMDDRVSREQPFDTSILARASHQP